MKVTRRMLRKFLLKEMVALSYGSGKRIDNLIDAQKYETYARLTLLPKKDRFETLHKITMNDSFTPQEVKVLGAFIESLQSPLKSGGSRKVMGISSQGTEGAGYYVQAANSVKTTSQAINNQCLGPSNATAPGSKYNAKFPATSQGIQSMLQACMQNANLAKNVGERCEIGLAMILALINVGQEYVAFTGSEAGADVKRVGGDIIYELKYSQTTGEINTMYSASPPTLSKPNKYYVFLMNERGYIVSSPLLAIIAGISLEVPESLSKEDIKAYEKDLFYYIGEVPEFFDKLYAATQASEFGNNIPELIPLMNNVIDKINSNQIAIDTCVKIIGINDLPVTSLGKFVSDKADIVKSPAPTQEEYQSALQEAREDFIGEDGKIKSYDSMKYGQQSRFRKIIIGMLQVSGAEQRVDSVTMPTPRIGIGGKGTPIYSMRKTAGTTASGTTFTGELKRADLPNSVKVAMIAGKTNDPNYPVNISANVLNNFINSGYKTNIKDANGNLVVQKYTRGPNAGQVKVYSNGNPKLVEVPLINEIKKDEKTLDELLKELLRNPVIFEGVLGEFKTSLFEDDIFGVAETLITNTDDGYFEDWAEDEPEMKNNPLTIQQLIANAKAQFPQSSQVAAAFILYTNYPRNSSLDDELFNALYLNNPNYQNVVEKAIKFVKDATIGSVTPDRNLLVTLLKRYSAMERKAYKFSESRTIYKKILKELLKYSK